MVLIRSFLLYFLVLSVYLFVFQKISNRKMTFLPVLLYYLLGSLCAFFFDQFTIIVDPVYLLVFSYVTKKNAPINHHFFIVFMPSLS